MCELCSVLWICGLKGPRVCACVPHLWGRCDQVFANTVCKLMQGCQLLFWFWLWLCIDGVVLD
jgi:hypothetical protein